MGYTNLPNYNEMPYIASCSLLDRGQR